MANWARSLITYERSKEPQDSSLARWLRHNPNCTKTFWVVSKRRSFKLDKTNLLAGGQEKYCSVIPPSCVYIRYPPGGARHSLGVHRGTPSVPAEKRGSLGLPKHTRQGKRADTVLEEFCWRGGIGRMCYYGTQTLLSVISGLEQGGCVYTLHMVFLTNSCYVSLNPF